MKITVDDAILAALPNETRLALLILAGIGELKTMITEIIQALKDEVVADTNATNAIIAVVNNFAAQVQANIGNEPALQEILAGFKANTTVIAAAAVANTPAAPAGNPEPPPVVEAPAEPAPVDTGVPV